MTGQRDDSVPPGGRPDRPPLDARTRATDLVLSIIFLVILAVAALYLGIAGLTSQLDPEASDALWLLAWGGAGTGLTTAAVGMGVAAMSVPRTRLLLPWPALGAVIALLTLAFVRAFA